MHGPGLREVLVAGLAGLWLALLPPVLAPAPANAQAADGALAAARALSEATDALAAAESGQDQVAALTRTIGAFEDGLATLREELRRAAIAEASIQRRYEARAAEVAQLLGVLMALDSGDGPLLLLHPSGPLGTVHSGLLVAEMGVALQREVTAIRADLGEIAALRSVQETALDTLEQGLHQVQEARIALSQAIADRTALPMRLTEDPDAMRVLAQGAETLDAFASEISALALPGLENLYVEPEAGFLERRGQLPLPVQATLLRRAGEADAAGIQRPGIILAVRPRALVTAPVSGTIRFRGPFLDYGNVMILEPAEDYLLVIAGLDIVYGDVGEVVSGGTALGLMGGEDPLATEFLAEARQGSGGRTQTLYLEVRQGGAPVDPAEWFAVTGD